MSPTLMLCPHCVTKSNGGEEEMQPLRGILEVEGPSLLSIDKSFFPNIPMNQTPLWSPTRLRDNLGLPNLFIKDDSSNPTGSFKDRASFLVSAFAKKFNINQITLASTGNAGSSMAGIGAAAGQDITIFLPKSAPPNKLIQALQYGATVYTVDGNYDMAYEFSLEFSKLKGGLNRNTAYNPMTIEGKKTVSLEIVEQLGHEPDIVFVPTGDGCILSGVYKGFRDLLKFNKIKKIPKVIAVQAEGSATLFNAFHHPKNQFELIQAQTVADSISVDMPRNGYHALMQLKKYNGGCITVTDKEIIKAQHQLAKFSGVFTEPAGATSYAGLLKSIKSIDKNDSIVILATGSGLKDPSTAMKGITVPSKAIKSVQEIL
jgi:threonine synthase